MKRRKRLLWLLATGLVPIAATAAYTDLHFHFPVGEGPAGPAVPVDPFEQPWTPHKVLLLGVGDSVTAGFGSTPGHSYFERLVTNPPDEFPDMQGRCLSRVL